MGRMTSFAQLAPVCEATILDPGTGAEAAKAFAVEAVDAGVRGVSIPPTLVGAVSPAFDAGLLVISTSGAPTGLHHTLVKAAEARLSVQFGVGEIEVAPDPAAVAAGDENALLAEFVAVREGITEQVALTVVVDAAAPHLEVLASAAAKAGASALKVDARSRAVRAVARAAKSSAGDLAVKASGRIVSMDEALSFIDAGATRLALGDLNWAR